MGEDQYYVEDVGAAVQFVRKPRTGTSVSRKAVVSFIVSLSDDLPKGRQRVIYFSDRYYPRKEGRLFASLSSTVKCSCDSIRLWLVPKLTEQ